MKSFCKRFFLPSLFCAILLTSGGCGFVGDGPFGWAVTNTKTPLYKGKAKSGNRAGMACVHSVLGMVTLGDGSIETAMRKAGITEVYTIDKDNFSLFGTYSRQCTVVLGN